MEHMTSRSRLMTALMLGVGAFSNLPGGLLPDLRRASGPPAPRARQPRRYGRGKARDGFPRLFCKAASRYAVKYEKLAPKTVTGVRLRWEAGKLIPRDTKVMGVPLRKRQAERLAAKRRKLERPKKPRPANGGYRRGDMQGAMRAARRAGIISARQQRRLHRNARAGLTTQHLRAMLEHPDAREVLES